MHSVQLYRFFLIYEHVIFFHLNRQLDHMRCVPTYVNIFLLIGESRNLFLKKVGVVEKLLCYCWLKNGWKAPTWYVHDPCHFISGQTELKNTYFYNNKLPYAKGRKFFFNLILLSKSADDQLNGFISANKKTSYKLV